MLARFCKAPAHRAFLLSTTNLNNNHAARIFSTVSRHLSSSTTTPMALQVERVPCLSDNYAWIIRTDDGTVAVVDPSETGPVASFIDRSFGGKLDYILNTHHHMDHTGGNLSLKSRYGATIVGPLADKERIPGIDVALTHNEKYKVGNTELVCYDTPGHTAGHVTFYFDDGKALFPGDTLFSLGCGRLFEGTPEQMWASLSLLKNLPTDTQVYCAHEYTQSNAKFAIHIEPQNEDLKAMKADIDAKRAKKIPTVPSVLGDEIKCNPFLRPDSVEIRKNLGVAEGASDVEAFAAIRKAKDSFR